MKIKRFFFLFVSSILLITINYTNAKYVALEFGDVFNIKLSKYSVYAEEFVIDPDNYIEGENGKYWESENLWGAGEPPSNANLNNWAPDYTIDKLENVSFSARNTTLETLLIIFDVEVFFFKNSDVLMNFTFQNTISNEYQYLKGAIDVNKNQVDSKYCIVGSYDTTNNFNKQNFTFNPFEYYKKVELTNTTLNFGDKDGDGFLSRAEYESFTPFNDSMPNEEYEKPIIQNYFILSPGEFAEFNIAVVEDAGNGSSNKSIYSKINMRAIISPYSTSN